MHATDQIYATPINKIGDFCFDERVADVFSDMIQRSIPGYQHILSVIGMLTERYAQPSSHLYDLGCSLGAATLAMRSHLPHSDCRIIGVDNSTAMVERCQRNLSKFRSEIDVEIREQNICDIELTNASVVVLNFTLQFLTPDERQILLNRIYQALRPGGILIVSEKFCFDDPTIHQLLTEMHLDFKRANGYSELEISQKRTALENVMLPDSIDDHQKRFALAGFSHSSVWYQCFNFGSMIAIK